MLLTWTQTVAPSVSTAETHRHVPPAAMAQTAPPPLVRHHADTPDITAREVLWSQGSVYTAAHHASYLRHQQPQQHLQHSHSITPPSTLQMGQSSSHDIPVSRRIRTHNTLSQTEKLIGVHPMGAQLGYLADPLAHLEHVGG